MPRVTRGTPTIDNNAAEAPYETQHPISPSSVLLTIPTLEDDDGDEVRSIQQEHNELKQFVDALSQSKYELTEQLAQLQQEHAKMVQDKNDMIRQLQQQNEALKQQLHLRTCDTVPSGTSSNGIDYKRVYYCHRTIEFLNRARKILWDRMEPGRLKHANGMYLGTCPWSLLAIHFRRMPGCVENVTKRTVTRNGKKALVPFKWFMFDTTLPDLGGRWSGKYYIRGNEVLRSDYISISFIVNTADDRVYCNWRSSSYMVYNGHYWPSM